MLEIRKYGGVIMKIPFREETYKVDDIYTFGSEPNNTIIEFENLFNKSGNVLDVGCGDGKNSLYFAKQGFLNNLFFWNTSFCK